MCITAESRLQWNLSWMELGYIAILPLAGNCHSYENFNVTSSTCIKEKPYLQRRKYSPLWFRHSQVSLYYYPCLLWSRCMRLYLSTCKAHLDDISTCGAESLVTACVCQVTIDQKHNIMQWMTVCRKSDMLTGTPATAWPATEFKPR
jgi:hypothetical protein